MEANPIAVIFCLILFSIGMAFLLKDFMMVKKIVKNQEEMVRLLKKIAGEDNKSDT